MISKLQMQEPKVKVIGTPTLRPQIDRYSYCFSLPSGASAKKTIIYSQGQGSCVVTFLFGKLSAVHTREIRNEHKI